MEQKAIDNRTLDNRVYELAQQVAELSARLTSMLDDVRNLKGQIWLVVTAAIVGPLMSAIVGHYWK